MAYALSTQGQGNTSYITTPSWIRGALSTDTWMLGITFKLFDLSANNHILGRSSSTAGSLRVLPAGELRYRDSTSDLITSPPNQILIDTYYTVVLRKLAAPTNVIELWVGPENMDENLIGGNKIGETPSVASQILNPLNQIGRFATTLRSDIEVKKFWTIGGTYTGKADETTASGSGTSWPLLNSGNELVITNATGAANSWWIFYDAGGSVNAEVDVLKSTVTLIAKAVQSVSDASVNTTKSTIQLFGKSLAVESSANVDLIKSLVQLNAKTIVGSVDGSVNVSKSIVSLVAKQLVGDTSTAVNAQADLLKSTVSIVGKSLTVSTDANVNLTKSLVNLIGKQLGLTNDAIVALSKSTVQLVGKVLIADSSASVNAVVDLLKGTVTLFGKDLVGSGDAGADLIKSTVTLTPKQLSIAADAQADLSKGVVQMTAKFLSVGDVAYSVPTDRIFFIPLNSVIFNIPETKYVFTITEDN